MPATAMANECVLMEMNLITNKRKNILMGCEADIIIFVNVWLAKLRLIENENEN